MHNAKSQNERLFCILRLLHSFRRHGCDVTHMTQHVTLTLTIIEKLMLTLYLRSRNRTDILIEAKPKPNDKF